VHDLINHIRVHACMRFVNGINLIDNGNVVPIYRMV